MANVIFKVGTKQQYQSLPSRDNDTLYWLTDTQELYKGDTLFGIGTEATAAAAGLLSAEDKKTLDKLAASTGLGLKAVDKSIILTPKEDGGETEIKVGLSTKEDNLIELDVDEGTGGLYVPEVKLALEKKTEGADDYAAVYRLKLTKNGSSSYADGEINVPKDIFFKECSLKTASAENTPYEGAVGGDPYLDVTLTNDTHSYIPLKGLVDTSNFVTRSIKGDVGEALITNDATGGGAWFRRNDGKEGFVGVNNGELANQKPSPMVQLYAADSATKKDGSFLSVYQDKITYTSQKHANAGGKLSEDDSEIATVRDIKESEDKASVLYLGNRYEVTNLLPGCRVDMNGKEIRVMFKEGAAFVKPEGTVEGRDNDCYYFGLKVYAPSDDVTGFKESDKETITDEPLEDFAGASSGVDKYGRKYDICWFPAAKYTDGQWKYNGDDSSPGRCMGWYHTIEWYKGEECVGSETVRINLTNKECHNSLKQYFGAANTPAGTIAWEEM